MKNENKKQRNEKIDSIEQLYVSFGKAGCLVLMIICAVSVPVNLGAGNIIMAGVNGLISLVICPF